MSLDSIGIGQSVLEVDLRIFVSLIVESEGVRILVTHTWLVVEKVSIGVALVGLRQYGQQPAGNRVDPVCWNPIAWERHAGKRVNQLGFQGAEVPPLHVSGGHVRKQCRALYDPQALIRSEEAQILPQRSTEAEAELIALVFWELLSQWIEEISSVEIIVSVELIKRSMKPATFLGRKGIDNLG